MRFRSLILFGLISLCFLLLAPNLVLASKFAYEVQMDKISVHGSQISNSLEYEEYASLSISCTYSYLKPYSCAEKERDKWTIGFYVDGKKMGSKTGIWPARSSVIGVKNGQPPCLARFMTLFKWKSTAGPHVLRCVINENQKIMRDMSNNNRLEKKVMVRKGEYVSKSTKAKASVEIKTQVESIKGHSQLVIKSGTKKKNEEITH